MADISKIKVDGESHSITASKFDLGDTQNAPYSSIHINESIARFGDDEWNRYLHYFYVAADDITMYTKNDIYINGYTGDDITINVNGQPLATQEWVLAQIQAALNPAP